MKMPLAVAVTAILLLTPYLAHGQAKIKIINIDGPGVGLNDPAPVQAVGGNPGRTLSQQRSIVFQYAADLWGALLVSGPEVRIDASLSPLTCTPSETVLGQAGPKAMVTGDKIFEDGAPDYYYFVSMANSISGKDFTPEVSHVGMEFNSSIDNPDCQRFGANGWFYGLHGNQVDNPGYRSNFLNVIMHEMGHGLGFAHANIAWRMFDSPYGEKAWSKDLAMFLNEIPADPAAVRTALTGPGRAVWRGDKASSTAALLAEQKKLFKIVSPEPALYEYVGATFGPQDRKAIKGEIVLVQDEVQQDGRVLNTGCDGSDGAPKIANRGALKGKVALVDMGGCGREVKILNAQNLGAVGLIIANNVPLDSLRLGNGGKVRSQISIPAISVTQEVGALLRSTEPVVAEGFVEDKTQRYGLDSNGDIMLYTPKAYSPGSTMSHIVIEMAPDFLMEAAEGRDMRADVMIDVTLDMLEEMGWSTNRNGTAKIGNCETGIPVYKDGFIPGANLMAHSSMCKTVHAASRAQQLRCMNDQINWLHDQTLLSSAEVVKARQCVAKL
ncbi:MAG: PA domain-containing protein [Stenotrophomonas sp.]